MLGRLLLCVLTGIGLWLLGKVAIVWLLAFNMSTADAYQLVGWVKGFIGCLAAFVIYQKPIITLIRGEDADR